MFIKETLMNQNLYFKFFILICLVGTLFGKVTFPNEIHKREILFVGEKRVEYYTLYKSNLTYTVYGPDSIKIYSRKAIPSRDNKVHSFGYRAVIDYKDTVNASFNKRIYSKIKSSEHKRHGYSSAGIQEIFIPPGKHNLELIPLTDSSRPVLIRTVIHPYKRDKGKGKFISPESETPLFFINFGEKKVRYLRLDSSNQMRFSLSESSRIKAICRLKYFDDMSNTQNYRLGLIKDGELLKTFVIQSEQSSKNLLLNENPLYVGEPNILEIELETGSYSFELLDENRSVYIRAMKYEI